MGCAMLSTRGLEGELGEPMMPVLDIRRYTLEYVVWGGATRALDAVDLTIARGEVVGLVGESGSGKTSLAWAIMRALPPNAREPSGEVRLSGEDLRSKTEADMTAIRGRRISMVFQDPSTSLNPTPKLGEQLAEVLVRHHGLSRGQAWREGEAMLSHVGIARPAEMMHRYPHEASGGEKQRVVIATAFACQPECIIFDEPTTALDVITARQILDLFAVLQAETKVASLYISHDLAVVSHVASRVAVIHRGQIVETSEARTVFRAPCNDYTRRLVAAVPHPARRLAGGAPEAVAAPLLEARGIGVQYSRPSLIADLLGRKAPRVVGARDVSFAIRPGEILGIVGESGSGKSTLAKALTGLNPFDGEIAYGGLTIRGAADMDRLYRRDVQIVFQQPDASLNPRQRVAEILSRPLLLYGRNGADRRGRVAELLEQVQLPGTYAERYPHQLSGGEKQRVAVARAFASGPKLVICDEITSALDVSVQAAVIELLLELQRSYGTTYLFITHDLNLVRQIAHRIAVMYRGELVELLPLDALAAGPRHPYTRSLFEAVLAPVG
jgi:peptide/nickel transport system ATP-binding protein